MGKRHVSQYANFGSLPVKQQKHTPVCYIILIGCYRNEGMKQMPDEPALW